MPGEELLKKFADSSGLPESTRQKLIQLATTQMATIPNDLTEKDRLEAIKKIFQNLNTELNNPTHN